MTDPIDPTAALPTTPLAAPDHEVPVVDRLSSGVPGLDTVLGGGFFRCGVYMVQGMPGCGKTILANQICYAHVKDGGSAVYVTLLAESHSRMIQHLATLAFFDLSAFPDRLAYISAFHDLESGGLKGLMAVLRREMRTRRVGVLVLDGLVAASEAAPSDLDLKKFVHELQSIAVLHGCTVLLLTSGSAQRTNAEHTMVDGLIELDDVVHEARAVRSIQVRKFRGAGPMRGRHVFRIDHRGITVYPRIEAVYSHLPNDAMSRSRVSTGVPTFDRLLAGGGLPADGCTVMLGSCGTGKTTFGLHFACAASADEPTIHLSFFEGPERLRGKAAALGLPLAELEAAGHVTLMWQPPGESLIDQIAHGLLEAVRQRRARRVVIDGLSGFLESAIFPERLNRFFACLSTELRREGVTSLMTLETRDVVSSVVSMPLGVSALVDNLVFLRYVNDDGRLERLLTVIKMRDTDYGAGMHRLRIRPGKGMEVAGIYLAGGDVIPSAEPKPAPGEGETRGEGGGGVNG